MASRLVKVRAVRAIAFDDTSLAKAAEGQDFAIGEGRNSQLCTKLVSYDQNLRHLLGLSPGLPEQREMWD